MKKKIIKIADLTTEGFSLQDIGVTQSLLSTFLQCRRKWLFKINKYYVRSQSKAIHFGNLIHKMLADWYTTGKYDINNWKDPDFKLPINEIELQKAKAEVLLSVYTKIYKKEKIEEVEEIFEYDFCGFKLLAKVDGLKIKSTIRPIDHKTAGRIDDDSLLDKLQMDFQLLFYSSIIDEYENKKCDGALYNVIRNPGHKLNKGETLKQYKERLLKEINNKPQHFFKRFDITLTRQDIKDYKDELVDKLDEMQQVVAGKLKIYRNESACIQGNFKCEFIKTCLAGNMSFCKKGEYVHRELEM